MEYNYEQIRATIITQIQTQKIFYKFRVFVYSLNREVRHHCFDLTHQFLENEFRGNLDLHVPERDRIQNLLYHWNWEAFTTHATNWWITLTTQHANCSSLVNVMNIWLENIGLIDTNTPDNRTDAGNLD